MAKETMMLDTLSTLGRRNAEEGDHWKPLVDALANPWSPENTDGM
jgi:hypothetical protein